MIQVPVWIQAMQALLTPVIGVGVLFVAFMQWKTARQKYVLDLFDRRFGIYMDFRRIVSEITQLGKVADPGLPNELLAGDYIFNRPAYD